MKKFLKENWFKLIIIIIFLIGILIIYYGFIFLLDKEKAGKEQQELFDFRAKCRLEGQKLYEIDKKEVEAKNKQYVTTIYSFTICKNPEFAYNKNLNTCLYYCYEWESTFSGSNAPDFVTNRYWIKDVFTNKKILHYTEYGSGATGTSVRGKYNISEEGCPLCVMSMKEFEERKIELFSK